MTQSPADTLRQIVMDMHRLHQHEIMSPAEYAIASAVRALAEAVLQVQMQLTREE